MQGATSANKQARNSDRAAAKEATWGKGDAKVVGADVAKGDAGTGAKAGNAAGGKGGAGNDDNKQDGATYHGMSATEAKDSQTIVALQSPVTVMRPVRGDLEEHVPKPCERAHS